MACSCNDASKWAHDKALLCRVHSRLSIARWNSTTLTSFEVGELYSFQGQRHVQSIKALYVIENDPSHFHICWSYNQPTTHYTLINTELTGHFPSQIDIERQARAYDKRDAYAWRKRLHLHMDVLWDYIYARIKQNLTISACLVLINVQTEADLLIQLLKGCGMGPPLVLVSPCFRGNVVVTCKIGSFLCSLDNLLQKIVIVFFLGNQISKWRSFEKRAIFGLLFTFFSHQGKVTKIPSARISLTYIHVFCSPYWLFCNTNCEKIRIHQVWFLFGVIPGVDSYSRHFGTINK